MRKVRVMLERCIGAGNCVDAAPRVFQLNSMRQAQVANPAGADDATLLEAARSCPTGAVILLDDDGRRVYPPEDPAQD